ISGIEVAVEGMLTRGHLEILTIFDKPDPLNGPFFEETYYTSPTRLNEDTQTEIYNTVQAACQAYGLKEGPIHAECRVNDQGIWIIEVAARTIGGLCSRLFQLATGQDLEQVVLAHALGMAVPTCVIEGGSGVLMIPIPGAGILRRVEGTLKAQSTPFIEEVSIDLREGYELVPLPEGASYLGFIFSKAPNPELAEQALRQAHACLNVVIAPLWKGMVVS
ncbi:MAG: ATP-grasp domain-containing protein, partial [Gammaproteobacteria bacterium]|nr:ATP-grasp domain-containing protein [Gammaproteobacteria bacterium]